MSDSLPENTVNEYIAQCPKDIQAKLKEIRALIREVAPGATERTDYFYLPGYSYPGYDYQGMFVWFSYKKPNLRLHLRPPVIQNHGRELAGYKTTKSIVNFPEDVELPTGLMKKLVNSSLKTMRDGPRQFNESVQDVWWEDKPSQ